MKKIVLESASRGVDYRIIEDGKIFRVEVNRRLGDGWERLTWGESKQQAQRAAQTLIHHMTSK